MLKVIIILALLYFVYRALGGEIKLPTKKSTKSNENDDANTLVECCKCGLYITQKEAIKKFNNFYCTDCTKG